MATLKTVNGNFWIDFRYRGKRHRRSLKTRDERAANAALVRLADTLHRLEIGALVVPPHVDVGSFLLADGRIQDKQEEAVESPKIRTLKELCDQSLASIPPGSLEELTIKGMEIHARHLKRIMKATAELSGIGLNELQHYVNRRSKQKGIRKRKISPATIEKELVTLRWMWRWAKKAKLVDHEFPGLKGIRYPKTAEKPRFKTREEILRILNRGGLSRHQESELWDSLFLTTAEIDELLEHVKTSARLPFVFPMVAFAAHTGARRSEMIRSKIDDIDLESGFATIHEKKRKHGRLTTRTVPLSPNLINVLTSWLADHPGGNFTFCLAPEEQRTEARRTKRCPLTSDQAANYLKYSLRGSKWENLRGWHVFRHSFCSNCAAAGLDQRTINAWVGHQTDEMVKRYRHLIPDKQQEDIQKVFGNGISQTQ